MVLGLPAWVVLLAVAIFGLIILWIAGVIDNHTPRYPVNDKDDS